MNKISQMATQIEKLLADFYVTESHFTHVSMIQPKGKYNLTWKRTEEFWKLYCDQCVDSSAPAIGIGEVVPEYLPVIVDIDLKFTSGSYREQFYKDSHVKLMIDCYRKVLKTIIKDCTDKMLMCVVLEKPAYAVEQQADLYKNGFHLHFPNIVIHKVDQEVQLIPRIRKVVAEQKEFEELGQASVVDIVDTGCYRAPWLLYGSRKHENKDAYRVTKVYDTRNNLLSYQEAFKDHTVLDANDTPIDVSRDIEYFMPRILSIHVKQNPVELRNDLESMKTHILARKAPVRKKVERRSTPEKDLKDAGIFLSMLHSSRADNRNDWMTIGWILFNVTGGSEEGLELWLDFSQQSSKYRENVCIYEWERMEEGNYSMGTLRYFAREDDPKAYQQYLEEQAKDVISESVLSNTHYDIALVLYTKYKDVFVCCSITNRTWYEFVGHRWKQMEEGITLRRKISDELVLTLKTLRDECSRKIALVDDAVQADYIKKRIDQIKKVMNNIKNAPFKSNVMRECAELFYEPEFTEKLNTNPELVAFTNGVYDLKLDQFRDGRPEDYLSQCMPIKYKEFTSDADEVSEVYQFLEKVFPDKSLRRFFMDVSSETFLGGNQRKVVQFWTGEGDNGKSITQKIFEQMFGKLSVTLPTTVITTKRPTSGQAWPELTRAGNGVRMAFMDEPDLGEEINTGVFKHLSGNDTFAARDLYQKGSEMREITPLFKLIFICNKLPKMRGGGDKATWNRVRVIPFEATFCGPDDPPPKTYEEQLYQKRFPMDPTFSMKIPKLVEAFAWVLIHHRLRPKLPQDPPKVTQATRSYRADNDYFQQFFQKCMEEAPNHKLSVVLLYSQYKNWVKEQLPGSQPAARPEVEDYFIKMLGPLDKTDQWTGYRIKCVTSMGDDAEEIVGVDDLM